MHAFPNELGTARLGLSVSRKVGSAVVRNSVRRRLREVFYEIEPELRSNLDLVVSARPASAQASYSDVRAEFVRALDKLEGSSASADMSKD